MPEDSLPPRSSFPYTPGSPPPAHRAADAGEYYALWRDVSTSYSCIAEHYPGPFTIDTEYCQFLLGFCQPIVTGVEGNSPDAASTQGIRRMGQSPVSGGTVTIQIGTGVKGQGTLEIYDVTGRLVKAVGIFHIGNLLDLELNVADLPSGLFFARVVTSRGKVIGPTKKLVVTK